MWAPVGQQPEVPAPGKNEKQVVYGGVNYKTGRLTYTLAATKCGAAFLVFLAVLLKHYVGRHIVLVCDSQEPLAAAPAYARSVARTATTSGWMRLMLSRST